MFHQLPMDRGFWRQSRVLRRVKAGVICTVGLSLTLLAGAAGLADVPSTGAAPATSPAPQEVAENWPCFRGPAAGAAHGAALPEFDGPTGKNILWKTAIPLPGFNSPIVWKNRVFLSGATAEKQEVYCFDAKNGALLWSTAVGHPAADSAAEISSDTGYAPSTLATDGQHVFAIFVTGDLAALDFKGHVAWSKNLGQPDNAYGHAASLACWQDRLLVQLDQGENADQKKSALLALDSATGREVWKTPRPVGSSWATPLLVPAEGGPQVITAANPWVIAYEPATGKELWRANVLDGEVAPSPAFAAGVVYVANERAKAAAIKPIGHGDITATQVLWSAEDGLPDVVSPLATPDFLFLVTTAGVVTCYDAKNGKKLWAQDLEASFHASPILLDKAIFLIDRAGVLHRFAAEGAYRSMGTSSLGEPVSATPAIVAGHAFIRSKAHLYCIGPN